MRPFILFLLLFSVFSPVMTPSRAYAQNSASESPDDRFDFADGLYARRMYEMAASEYSRLLKEFPENKRAGDSSFRLAESLYMLQDHDAALKQYKEFLNAYPDHEQADAARLRIAEASFRLGEKESVLPEFMKMTSSKDDAIRLSAHYYAGKILYELERFDKAKTQFEVLLKEETEESVYHDVAVYHLGKIALKQGRLEDADEYFKKLSKTENPAFEALASFGLGQAAFQSENYAQAASYFRTAYEQAETPDVRDDAFLNYMKSIYREKDYAEVIKTFETSEAIDHPDAFSFYLVAANSYFYLDQADKAIPVFKKMLSLPNLQSGQREVTELGLLESFLKEEAYDQALAFIDSLSPDVTRPERFYYLEIEMLKRAGKTEKALEKMADFTKEYEDSVYTPNVLLARAYIELDNNNLEEARRGFDEFLLKYPDHELTRQTLLNRISLDIKLKDWEAAEQSSKAYLERFSDSEETPEVSFQLAWVYLQRDSYEAAEKAYTQYIKTYPDSPKKDEAVFFLAFTQQQAGQLDKAAETYKNVKKENVSDEIYYASLKNRAYSYIQNGKAEKAVEAYHDIMKNFPDKRLSDDVYFWMADHYLENNDPEKLLDSLSPVNVEELTPERKADYYYFRAEALRLKDKPEEALKSYQLAMDSGEAPVAEVLLGRGIALAALGRTDEARETFQQSIKVAGDNYALAIKARLKIAEQHEKQGSYLDAAKGYMAVAILYDDDKTVPAALMKAAENFEKGGKLEEAQTARRELVQKYPDSDEAKQIASETSSGNL